MPLSSPLALLASCATRDGSTVACEQMGDSLLSDLKRFLYRLDSQTWRYFSLKMSMKSTKANHTRTKKTNNTSRQISGRNIQRKKMWSHLPNPQLLTVRSPHRLPCPQPLRRHHHHPPHRQQRILFPSNKIVIIIIIITGPSVKTEYMRAWNAKDPAHRILSSRDPSGWSMSRGRPHASWLRQVESYLKDAGMAGLASAWAMARRRPKEYRRKEDAATRCSGVCPHTWPDLNFNSLTCLFEPFQNRILIRMSS